MEPLQSGADAPEICDHESFRAQVNVARISDAAIWYAELTVTCEQCGKEMEFVGFPMGMSPGEPMVNVTCTELRIPFRPFDEAGARRRLLGDNHSGFTVSREEM